MSQKTQHNDEKDFWTAAPALTSPIPDNEAIDRLHRQNKTPTPIRFHEERVACTALLLADKLISAGVAVNKALMHAAALCHDVRRTDGKKHAESGAAVLCDAGFHGVAALVALHTVQYGRACTEARLLYLADKVSSKDRVCTIDEREERMMAQIESIEGRAEAHRRLNVARLIAHHFEATTGLSVDELLR